MSLATAGISLLALVAATGSAAAAAPKQIVSAPDGSVEIRDGAAVVARVAFKTPALRRGTPRLRELDVDGHAVAELRLPVRGSSAEEVWIAELPAAAHARGASGGKDKPAAGPAAIWTGVDGPRDVDEETAIHVDVSADEILEYQTAAQIGRCDGAPPRLFPRAWDWDSRRFRPVVSPLPPPAAQKLTARRGDPAMPAGRPLGGFHWTGASTTAAAGSDARALTPPLALDDGNPATAWAEGLGGDGRGEFLTARSASGGYAVRGLRIVPGDASSAAAFQGKNRLRGFQIAFGPAAGQRFDVEIPDDPAADRAHFADPYWVPLPQPVPASCVTVVITDVARGGDAAPPRNYGTTAIADIDVFTELDGPQGADRLVADIAGGADCEQRVGLLVGLGDAAVLPTAQSVLTSGGIGRQCLVEALAALPSTPRSPIATDALAGALVGASDKEERLVTETLKKAPAPPVGALAQILSGQGLPAGKPAAPEDRARAARVLGTLPGADAAAALMAAAGQGPELLRTAVIGALAASPAVDPAALLAAVAAAEAEAKAHAQGPAGAGASGGASARYADLLRALVAAVKHRPDRQPPLLAALHGALDPARDFEVRARAVMAIGDLGAAAGAADLAALRATSDDPVLRFLAARELAAVGGPQAVAALRDALGDRDPRVRETAALGLGQHTDRPSGQPLIDGAKQEPWPFVRRAELEALGHLCVAGTGDLMIRATQRDVDQVRRAALVSLVRCKDPRTKKILLRAIGRHSETATLRELAAALVGELDDATAASDLATALHKLVNESEGDMALEGAAAAALKALAHLGGPAAVSSAVTLASDTHHPLRQAAIEALGTLCDPGAGAATLQSIAAGPDAATAVAALAAQHRCAGK
jgi:HEAT repeat protein